MQRDTALATLALAPHHPHSKRNYGCFRCYHPLPQGASPGPPAAAWRRAGPDAQRPDPIGANRAPKHARKKALSAPIAPGNARLRSRATPRRGNERHHSTRADLFSRFRVHRLSSAARPPASSAARPSRCVVASASLPLCTRHERPAFRIVRSPASSTLTVLPAHLHAQAAAVNTTTEAAVKVAINGFGRIGTSPSRHRPGRSTTHRSCVSA